MSSIDQTKPRRDLDFLEGPDNNLSNFHDFDNINLRLEDNVNDNFDADSLQGYKIGSGAQNYRMQQGANDLIQSSAGQPMKYSEFYNQQAGVNQGNDSSFAYQTNYDQNQIKKQGSGNNGKVQNQQNGPNQFNNFQGVQNGGSYQNYSQDQLGIKGNGIREQSTSIGSQKQIQKVPSSNGLDQEQQKNIKLITALKSNPQDLEHILEEQEKQQIQKKMKVEADQKSNLQRHASSIQLTNYSPTRETLKRVESNTSLNGEKTTSSKNLSKIKGNVKNAYIKKITSLLNLQNPPNVDQQDNFQEPRRPDNSDDSDDSRSNSFDKTKQEEGKKVMKNRESARNSRQRKKIYIELLEKKISELTNQIEEQCVNIEKSQKEICKILDNYTHIKAFVQTRHDYLQKIGEMAYTEKPNNEQLGYILDSLRLRIGAQGTCRQKAISLYFRTIMKQFMQSTFPYLIYGYQPNMGEDQEFNRCVEIFKKICTISDETQVFKFLPYLKKFLEIRQNFKDCFQRMKKIRKNVFKREESIEKLLDGLSLLHPTQMGKFLKGLDKFRKLREIRLQRKMNSGSQEDFEVDQTQLQKQYTANPDRQLNKLRQQTVQNQYINNNQSNNYAQFHSQQQFYQPISHPPQNLEILEENELPQQQKPLGVPQNYYYQKQQQPQQYLAGPMAFSSIKQDSAQQNGQNYIYPSQPSNMNSQNINLKNPIDYDQYYHQQPYKKQFPSNQQY
ncbi:bZIP transcription factor (macronuclear) [Tetrahymena thermophila SB210]|uniref:BZIP transcription factor n=1 Tax=Tetrahymena thermophila (strain SB210) TaxID=312017 RepID=I7M9U3_TETTS|nr:bZIP transcription factor [Tetrahymena thermophila SB210]EAS02819.2 bZIP transcription factor [Tetrahymena thermophila SB210]|eukprot:XP_001023064.2 bZIP transcription factor [Tetrahymena thermophila SB210]